ncbi:MAG: c-type cytochrome [Planctomycetales bacterium]|nr:c-type cytochrome [Planctomycetales bacterium]
MPLSSCSFRCSAKHTAACLAIAVVLVLPIVHLIAADKSAKPSAADFKSELPRIPAVEPKDALATFQVQPPYHLELVAAEPLVADPIAISFDENGRAFVVEMCDYSEQDKDFLGKIRLLEDTDEDGRFDKSTVFADKLSWPTAVICWDGGIFVGAPPEIYYLKDTDGDNKADVRKLVFTGFRRTNVQGMMNSFHWGLDNRIHGSASSTGGLIRRVENGEPVGPEINVNGRDFAFDPRTLEMTATSGGAQHGMCFDDWGRKFCSSNSDHIQMVMFEDRYVARNPYLAAPGPRLSIAADGPQAEVFRISPVEPWRIVRTRLRVAGAVPGPIEGGGRAAGYFTGATGVTIYRGDAWPDADRGLAIVGDVGSNLVHRKRLEPNGVAFVAKRIDEGKEFIASKDIWFRPVQYANAPDGSLFILDMYREVIEHPASLPPEIKQHLDLTSGRDRGRIYRVVPDGFKQRKLPRLGTASTADLVATLEHRNGWHRDTACRLLFQRQDKSAIEPLRKLVRESKLPEARMHAMAALRGMNALTEDVVLDSLHDVDSRVVEHAIRVSELVTSRDEGVRLFLCDKAYDDAVGREAYQLAFTLGELPETRRERTAKPDVPAYNRTALAALLALPSISEDRWTRLAVLSSLSTGSAEALVQLTKYVPSPGRREALGQLAFQVGAKAVAQEVDMVVAAIESSNDTASAALMTRKLSEGFVRAKLSADSPLRRRFASTREKLLTRSREIAADDDSEQPIVNRLDAIRTLELSSFAADGKLLGELLAGRQPQDVQRAAVATLGEFADPAVGSLLVEAWSSFSPVLRSAATDVIVSRESWLNTFLDAIEKETIPAADLDPARVKLLEKHQNAKVRERIQQFASKNKISKRADVLAAYQSSLTIKGEAPRGKLAFAKICANCHKLEGAGHEIGPNLATLQNRGADTILLNVLDPNREVNPQYVNYLVVTKEGKTLTGIIAGETASSLTLKRAEGVTDTVLRIDIDELKSTGLSIMPEGVEKQIDQQAMADLIAYLLSVK